MKSVLLWACEEAVKIILGSFSNFSIHEPR